MDNVEKKTEDLMEKKEMLDNEELADDELDDIAGGGAYDIQPSGIL